jgi:hypothetical protein
VQGVHHILWYAQVAYTKSEWSSVKFSSQICIEENTSAFLEWQTWFKGVDTPIIFGVEKVTPLSKITDFISNWCVAPIHTKMFGVSWPCTPEILAPLVCIIPYTKCTGVHYGLHQLASVCIKVHNRHFGVHTYFTPFWCP